MKPEGVEHVHFNLDPDKPSKWVAFINIPIIKFSVDWWNTLHQPASVLRMDGSTIDWSIRWPLLVLGLAYTFLFLALHLTSMRSEITARKLRNLQIARSGEA